jgi:hypothetical protein
VDAKLPLPSSAFRRRALLAAAELVFFAVLALYSTWPLAAEIRTALPLATESVAAVPLLNLWTIWWNADRLADWCSGYWDAPIFYPTAATFAFSEPQPVSMTAAPLVWVSATPVVAYNVYLIFSLALNGCAGAWLVRQIGGNRWSAIAGGAMLLMLPFVHWQLGVLQLVPVWGVLWTIGALRQFGEEPRIIRALSLGLALGLTYLSCAYHGLFLVLVLLGSVPWLLGKNLWNWRTPIYLAPGALVCLALVYPVLSKQREIIRKFEFERTADIITTLSAEVGDYSVTPWPQLIRGPDFADPERRPYWHLGPGSFKLLLAMVGVVIGLIDRRLRMWTAFAITFTVAAVLLSMGLKLQISGWVPYQVLIDRFPGMAQVRNVFRFALFAQLMVALLAAQGLAVLSPAFWQRVGKRLRCRRNRSDAGDISASEGLPACGIGRGWEVAGVLATVIVGGAAALEVRPPAQNLFRLPPPEADSGWISWLEQNSSPAAVIACVPFPVGATVDDYEDTTLWMYFGAFHRRRMVNGYSGFFPPPYMKLKPKMDNFPDEAGIDELERLDVTYCVVRRKSVDPAAWSRIFAFIPARLKPLYWDEMADVGIFELVADEADSAGDGSDPQ